MVIDLSNKVHGRSKVFTRTDTLSRYYQDIRHFDILSSDDEMKLFSKLDKHKRISEELGKQLTNAPTIEKRKSILDAIKKNNELIGELKDTIVNHNQRFVVTVAKKYATDTTLMDLISEGNIGLIEAIDTYTPGKGTKFTSWAVYYIRRSINQYRMEVEPHIKETNRQNTRYTKVSAYNKFVQTYQYEPSISELAEFISNNYSKAVNESDLVGASVSSVDEGFGENEATPSALKMAMSTQPEEKAAEEREYSSFIAEKLVGRLSEKEQTVINMSFGIGYDREYEPDDIAAILGLGKERVRQIKREAISKMRNLAMWHNFR